MTIYFDTSSLVKLYITEAFSDQVLSWAESAEVLATSRVALPEVASAFARRWREGDLDDAGFRAARQALSEQWLHFNVIDVNERLAAELVIRHGLRGFDAIHLAAALEMNETARYTEPPYQVFFSSFDTRLNKAARSEGLPLLAEV